MAFYAIYLFYSGVLCDCMIKMPILLPPRPLSFIRLEMSPIIVRHLGNIGFISASSFALFFAPPPVQDAGRSFEKK